MTNINDMTTGSPTRGILRFAIPLVAGYLLQQMYTVADAAIVGHCIGVKALAAVGASFSIMFLIMGFCNGVCAGFAIPVSQAFGAKDYGEMRIRVSHGIRLASLIALLLTIITSLLCYPILRLLSTPDDIMSDAHTFLILQFLSIPFTMAYNMSASLLRALGNSQQPFYFLILASVLNILLSVLMIVGCGMGVEGAGFATMLSQGISALVCWLYVARHVAILVPHGTEWNYGKRHASLLLGNGIPMGLQFSITAVGIIMLQSANNALGTLYVASFTVAMRVKYLFTCVFENIGVAMATYCGQNIGARQLHRIKQGIRSSLMISMAYFLFTLSIIQPLADDMMLIFVDSSQQDIITNAALLMRIACWFYPVLGLLTILRYSIQGLGYSGLSMMSGIMEMLARGGVSIWLVPMAHYIGVCYGDPAAWIAAVMFLIPATWVLLRRLGTTVTQ